MKRIVQILLLAIFAVSLFIPSLADEETIYSRAIILPKLEKSETIETGTVFTINYYPGLGTGSTTTETFGYGLDKDGKQENPRVEIASPSGITAPAGAEFSGWSTQKQISLTSGTANPSYAPGRIVELKLPKGETSYTLNLYAVYKETGKEKETTLYYHPNGASGSTQLDPDGPYMDGETITLKDYSYFGWTEPKGKTFVGWSTDSGAYSGISAGKSVVVTGKANHLYAIWLRDDGKPHVLISEYIYPKEYNKDGTLHRYKPGETVNLTIVVTNTGNEYIKSAEVSVSGARIKKKSDYDLHKGKVILYDLAPGETRYIKATHVVSRSDTYRSKVVSTAKVTAKGESGKKATDHDSCRIPVRRSHYEENVIQTTTITVYADTTLASVLNRIVSSFELTYPNYDVNVVYGDAAGFASQIERYGGRDVLITVGDAAMDRLDIYQDSSVNPGRVNRIISTSRKEAMADRATIAGRTGTVISFAQLKSVLGAGQAKLAISTGNDMAAKFALDIVSSYGLDLATLKSTGAIVECTNSAEVASAVRSGKADLGIMSGSATVAAGLTAADVAKDSYSDAVYYPAAVLRGTASETAAQAFVNYLRYNEVRNIIQDFGYSLQ